MRRFQQVIRDTDLWANKNDEKSAAILEKYTSVSAETAKSMVRTTYPDALTDALVQPVIDVAVKYGGGTAFLRARYDLSPGLTFWRSTP